MSFLQQQDTDIISLHHMGECFELLCDTKSIRQSNRPTNQIHHIYAHQPITPICHIPVGTAPFGTAVCLLFPSFLKGGMEQDIKFCHQNFLQIHIVELSGLNFSEFNACNHSPMVFNYDILCHVHMSV